MADETAVVANPQRPPALHHRVLLPMLLVVALAVLQTWLEGEQQDERALLELIATQTRLARETDTLVTRAKYGEQAALSELDPRMHTARALLDGFTPAHSADRVLVNLVRGQWHTLRDTLAELHTLRERRDSAAADSRRVDELGTALVQRSDELLAVMAEAEETAARMRAAGRQLVLAQRMAEAARQALRSEDDVLVMADRLGRDAVLFGEVNNALVNGDPRLGLARVDSEAAHDIVLAVGDVYRELARFIERVMQDSVALYELRDAGAAAHVATRQLIDTLAEAGAAREALGAELAPALALRDALAALTLVALLGVALLLLRDRRRRIAQQLQFLGAARLAEEQHQALLAQAGALDAARRDSAGAMQQTLEAVRGGDLGARCELDAACWRELGADALQAERETLAALNRTLQALAERLTETRRTSRDVVRAINAAHESVRQVIDVGREQAGSLVETRPALAGEVESLDGQAQTAAQLARVAREGSTRSRAAADVAREAHAHAAGALEQLGVAARLTGHLHERGGELRELVRLLDDVADEGRILALNAAIHASLSRVGESGGDALSQAVQRLADGVAHVERRCAALADALERSGEECVDTLRRAVSGVSGSVQLAAVAGERSAEVAGDGEQLAERCGAHAAASAALSTGSTRRQAGVLRVEQVSAVLQQAAHDSDQQLQRAHDLVELLSAHLAALRLPAHEDANVVDLRDFIKRS